MVFVKKRWKMEIVRGEEVEDGVCERRIGGWCL
jgi:hypothetical protein